MRFLSILLLGIWFVAASGTAVAEENGLDRSVVSAWLDGYKNAWENRDAEQAAALFTEDATYRVNPHEDPNEGRSGIREYWSNVTADQRDITFGSKILTTYGRTAVVHWTAEFNSISSGSKINLDGIFLLNFNDAGLCTRLREWWHIKVEEGNGE